MKYVFVVVSLSLFFSSTLFTQEDTTKPVDKEIFIMGGISIPYLPEEFRNIWGSGWNAGVGYGYSFSPGKIGYASLYASVEYNRLPLDKLDYRRMLLEQYPDQANVIQQGTIVGRGTAKVFTFFVNFKGAFSTTKSTVAPYFLVGIGYMYFTSDSIAIAGKNLYTIKEENKSAFTWSFGVGLEVPIFKSFGLFVQGKSVLGVLDRTRQYFPVSGGIRYKM